MYDDYFDYHHYLKFVYMDILSFLQTVTGTYAK